MQNKLISTNFINKILSKEKLDSIEKILDFLEKEKNNYSFYDLSKIVELANQKRTKNSAYYTDSELLDLIKNKLPSFSSRKIKILEPSVGIGNFIPLLFEKYTENEVDLDVIDIDCDSLKILKKLLEIYGTPANFNINFIDCDFLQFDIKEKYDLIIGNPPFSKVKRSYINSLNRSDFFNLNSLNLSSYFLEKCINFSKNLCMIMPKNLLNTPDFAKTREFLLDKNLSAILDFGEKGFKGVLVETILICLNDCKNQFVEIYSVSKNIKIQQKLEYIAEKTFPYWIIYRNEFFDEFSKKMKLGIFSVFRDRQITTSLTNKKRGIRVLKSRNISDDGTTILNLKDYDEYIELEKASKLNVFKFLNKDNLYLTPNMTYKIRVMKKPKNVLTNGSIAILSLKSNITLSSDDLLYFSTINYREFMQIARNYQTRTLNVDSSSIYFYGKRW